MIPVYLIVDGCLHVLFAAIKIYNIWPLPKSTNRPNLSIQVACKATEIVICVAIMIWLILGKVAILFGILLYFHFLYYFISANCELNRLHYLSLLVLHNNIIRIMPE